MKAQRSRRKKAFNFFVKTAIIITPIAAAVTMLNDGREFASSFGSKESKDSVSRDIDKGERARSNRQRPVIKAASKLPKSNEKITPSKPGLELISEVKMDDTEFLEVSIYGRVVDNKNEPVSDVLVEIAGYDNKVITSENGRFKINQKVNNLAADNQQVKIILTKGSRNEEYYINPTQGKFSKDFVLN